MRAVDIIAKKRDGDELSRAELDFLIAGYVAGDIPDYQMAAWAMAVYFCDMTARETADLTMTMADSGDRCDLSAIPGIKVDKHSTGGVADTTTLIVAPLAAACGVPVAKMSGRGLGHTGGTIDKLDAFSGFRTEVPLSEFVDWVNEHGLAVIGQSERIAPADKLLYGLRDVTATVPSIPLIASSIMSKKLALGADAIVLDVKVGEGAFMKDLESALALARAMVDIGRNTGRRTVAVLSEMSRPLGRAIGNALEIKEALAVLRNERGGALRDLSLELASRMLLLGGICTDLKAARAQAEAALQSGQALAALRRMVAAQGGDSVAVDDPGRLPVAGRLIPVLAEQTGYVGAVTPSVLGRAAMVAGAGRAQKASAIDLGAGIVLQTEVGERVEAGQPLCTIHTNLTWSPEQERALLSEVASAFLISEHAPEASPVLLGWVDEL